MNSSSGPTVPRPIEQQVAFSQSQVPVPLMQQNAAANVPAGSVNLQSMPFADPTQALLSKSDLSMNVDSFEQRRLTVLRFLRVPALL